MTLTEDQLEVKENGPGALDGSGIVASANDLMHSRSPVEAVPNGIAVGLSALGVIKDPFESALTAGVGWVIEHVAFLREPLDALAGNPRAIEAHAKTWQNVAKQLEATARQRASGVAELSGWQGDARLAYQTAATQQADKIQQACGAADELSRQVLLAGAAVGTVRSLIRDLIATFIAKVVERLILAGLTAIETLGLSAAAVIADIVVEGIALAGTIAGKIAELVKTLGHSSKVLTGLSGKMDDLSQGLGKVGAKAASELPDALGNRVSATIDQGVSMLSPRMRDWAANPPRGLGNVVRQAVTASKDDVVANLREPVGYWGKKAGLGTWKQDAKATATQDGWTPL